jgi:hypothetical protein
MLLKLFQASFDRIDTTSEKGVKLMEARRFAKEDYVNLFEICI